MEVKVASSGTCSLQKEPVCQIVQPTGVSRFYPDPGFSSLGNLLAALSEFSILLA